MEPPRDVHTVSKTISGLIAVLVALGATSYLFKDSFSSLKPLSPPTSALDLQFTQEAARELETASAAANVPPPQGAYYLYFSRGATQGGCTKLYPIARSGLNGAGREAEALFALVGGPTAAERRNGVVSFFSPETADIVRSITVRGSTAYVDFSPVSKNMSQWDTLCAKRALRAAADMTLKQFGAVAMVRYSLNGSSRAFDDWSKVY